jgi:hypothetical protein
VAWIGDAVLQGPVIGKDHQAFAVPVQASGGIDAPQRHMIGQGPPARAIGELAEDVVRLVEEDDLRHATIPVKCLK